MSRVLFAWELGGSLGHLTSLQPLTIEFLKRGHQVFLAARDLSQLQTVFAGIDVTLLQAPWNARCKGILQPVITYADLLLNVGFSDANALSSHVSAWKSIYDLVKPDLLVCDHSPTALLAARGYHFAI